MHCRALDRLLQWGHYVIPQFHIGADRLVFWNKFGRPDKIPSAGVQIDSWWQDTEKAERIQDTVGIRKVAGDPS